MTEIFLSYARADKAEARVVADRFAAEGWAVWWDPELLPHVPYRDVIDRELATARCIVVLWSKEARGSAWVLSEASAGLEMRKLVQIGLDNERPPRPFDQWQMAAIGPGVPEADRERQWRTVLASVRVLTGHDPTPAAAPGFVGPPPVAGEPRPDPAPAVSSAASPGPTLPPAPSPSRTADPEPALRTKPLDRRMLAAVIGAAALVLGGGGAALLLTRPTPLAAAANAAAVQQPPPTKEELAEANTYTVLRLDPATSQPLVWDKDARKWLRGGVQVTQPNGETTIEAGGRTWQLKPDDGPGSELSTWEFAAQQANAGSPDMALAYLRQFPNGAHADAAKQFVKNLDDAICAKVQNGEAEPEIYRSSFPDGACPAARKR